MQNRNTVMQRHASSIETFTKYQISQTYKLNVYIQ